MPHSLMKPKHNISKMQYKFLKYVFSKEPSYRRLKKVYQHRMFVFYIYDMVVKWLTTSNEPEQALNSKSDQLLFSPCNINKISRREVTRIKQLINWVLWYWFIHYLWAFSRTFLLKTDLVTSNTASFITWAATSGNCSVKHNTRKHYYGAQSP